MSDHDGVIGNDTGAAVRADINLLSQAIINGFSGASAPAAPVAYQIWHDTTNVLLKQRNAANTGWLVRGNIAETFVLARSSNTILGVADFGKTINATSTFTQTLTAAATLGDGWWIYYRNNGAGVITFDPNGAEQIDGATTIYIGPGEGVVIFCNGSSFATIGRANGDYRATQRWTSSGTYTIPAGLKRLKYKVKGGGGGGGGGNASGGAGGGGGEAAEAQGTLDASTWTAGNTITITIGAAGSSGVPGANGGDGGDSTITSGTQAITTVTGGKGKGGIGSSGTYPSAGGDGGTATNGDRNIHGQAGALGVNDASNNGWGGLGGGQGGGLGGNNQNSAAGDGTAGGANTGAGGGGGGAAGGVRNGTGGAGAAGYIEFEEFF